jgi:hypothetical protein
MQKLQAFAWQSTQRGNTLHVAANPTAGELLHKEYLQKKDVLKTTSKTSILEKYGGEQYLDRLPKELLSGQSEQCKLNEFVKSVVADRQMSSTREREKSSKVKTSQRSAQDTTRMVRDSVILYFTILISSLTQQPQGSLGILVRSRIRTVGFRMLSFYQ